MQDIIKSRLVIADDHFLIRQGFQNIFANHPTIELVGTAANGIEAVRICQELKPDVVIMDMKMPEMSGVGATKELQSLLPNIGVLAFSMFDDEQTLIQMRLAGASGYLLKEADIEEITKAVRVLHAGGEYYCKSIRDRIDQLYKTGKLDHLIHTQRQHYSDVELKIITLLCQELTSKEIADTLKLTRRTVEHHKEKIQEKMNVKSSIGIVVFSLQNWLLNFGCLVVSNNLIEFFQD